jgi:hypothetical protein
LASENEWEKFETVIEIIKVRFSSDVIHTSRFTRNGVILPLDFIEGTAKDIMPWISRDLMKSHIIDG